MKEDINLCHSWLAVSCDPVTNTGQKKGAFWGWVHEAYNSHRDTFPERSQKSLEKRWETIKNECSRFASYMATVLRENSSGMTEADKVCVVLNSLMLCYHPYDALYICRKS